jgi:hypothetical protein
MTIHRYIALALALIAGIAGAFIGHAVPRNAPRAQTVASASPAPDTAPAVHDCNAERTELASTKVQLAICMATSMRAPATAPHDVPDASTPNPQEFESPEVKHNRELLESDAEAVIVRRTDGTIGIYEPDEWPADGDGLIIGRKFPDRQIGWYLRPVAGPRSDAAAFEQPIPPIFRGTSIELEPDGKISVRGKPPPPWVTRMLGGNVDEPVGN